MARTNAEWEWVAQVSLLRPGVFRLGPLCEEKPRSQKRDLGHPLKVGIKRALARTMCYS